MQTRDANGAPSCGGVSVGMYAWVRPWAKYADGTLTFYYGEKSSLGTDEYELNSGTFEPEWYKYHKTDITKVVFNESFKDARPETGYMWFAGMENLENIENLQNLNTSEMTYMRFMFWNCSKIQSLDLSNFNTAKVTDMEAMFLECSDLQSIKLSSFNTEKVWTMERMFYGCKKLQSLDLSNFNTEEVKNMYSMFEDCFILQSLDLSSFNTKKVNKMLRMFFNCNKLVSIYASNLFTTDNVSEYDSRQMFLYCDSLSGDIAYDQNCVDKTYAKIDGGYFRDKAYANRPWAKYADGTLTFQCGYKRVINKSNGEYELNTGYNTPGWNTDHKGDITKVVFDKSFQDARPTSCYYWFANCDNIEKFENLQYLNTSEVTNMEYMFYQLKKITELDVSHFDTQNVTNMYGMLGYIPNLTKLDVSHFDTRNVTNMRAMFYNTGCSQLDVSNFNTSEVKNMIKMFAYCRNLKSINFGDNFSTANVEYMYNMFDHCYSLKSIDLSSFNTGNVVNMSSMFEKCYGLEVIYASDKFTTDKVASSNNMFLDCTSLSGDIEYDKNTVDKTYAKIDGGYFRNKAYANRPWAKYADGTLTFFVSEFKKTIDGSNGEYKLNIGSDYPGWITDHKTDITKVVFDESFQVARPKSCAKWFYDCNNLKTIENIKYLNTSEVTDMRAMFMNCKSLNSIDVSNFNTAKVEDMRYMFYGCSSLQFLDLSNFNTEKVEYIFFMFTDCTNLKAIYASDKFTTDKISSIDSNAMFRDCKSLSGDIKYNYKFVDKTYAKIIGGYFRDKAYENRPWVKYDKDNKTLIFQCGYKRVIDNSNGEYELNTGDNEPGWKDKRSSTTKVVFDESFKDARPTTGYMWFYDFGYLAEIENISYLNTSEMTDMSYMFYRCEKLQSLDLSNFNAAMVTDMRYMFYDCSNLQSINLSNFNAAMVTDMHYMFYDCSNLQSINLSNFNAEKVTNMSNMFSDCPKLQSLDLSSFNTEMVETMRAMFSDCPNLQSLDLSNFNTEKVTDMSYMFNNCSKLQSIIISKDFTTKSMKFDTYMFVNCPAKLYTPMADYMARSDNKKIYTKIIKPYFPINAKAEYGTLCSPVGGTLGEGTFYGFDKLYEVDADKTNDTKVVMKEVTEIEAGKPYVYRRNLTDKDPVANAIIFNIDETAASAPQNPGMLKGTFESMIAPGGSYILQTDGMFHRVNDSNATLKVGAYRAYLDLGSLGSEAKTISMSFDDSETTGIREVNTADSSDTPIYDLTGRRINKPQRGQIYIQNGKKRVANF